MNVNDLYEFYLEAADLKDQAHVVKIVACTVQEFFVPRANKKEKKLVLRFENRRKSMILNKTQAGELVLISGSSETNDWIGLEVVLTKTKTNGKDTVKISAHNAAGV